MDGQTDGRTSNLVTFGDNIHLAFSSNVDRVLHLSKQFGDALLANREYILYTPSLLHLTKGTGTPREPR